MIADTNEKIEAKLMVKLFQESAAFEEETKVRNVWLES